MHILFTSYKFKSVLPQTGEVFLCDPKLPKINALNLRMFRNYTYKPICLKV